MISVNSSPTVKTVKSRVSTRPRKFDVMSRAPVQGPLPPLADRAADTDERAEALPGQVVAHLQAGDLQAEERVDAGQVPAQGRHAHRVEAAGLGARAAH